jgi:hypothetical protein
MQKAIVLNNEKAVVEMNAVLSDSNWRVTTIIPGGNGGAWLVILSDVKTWEDIVSKA